ncbi:cysteinyl-tRNA synthetase [Batrachochytrium dendrobatidis]
MTSSAAPIRQPDWHIPAGTTVPRLYINNSLTRKKELFVPEKGRRVTWYSCGPTVYDKSHVGHARTFFSFDIVRRIMSEYFGYDLQYVMNITDIDDKIIVSARQKHLFAKYKEANPVLNESVIVKAELGWHYFVNQRFEKYMKDAANNWAEFVSEFEAGKLVGAADDVKFGLYYKTAISSRDALAKAKSGNMCINDFYLALQDPLSLFIDSQEGAKTTDQQIFRDYAAYWEADFFHDMDSLNIRRPDVLTRVSEYIPEIIAFVQKIMSNGYAYEFDGSVYFDTVCFDRSDKHSYAKIEPWSAGNVKLVQEGEGDLTADTSGKRNISDFALWKSSKPGEPSWSSPWGEGRPGWHIECSAMAGCVLGEKIDIHSGGIDLTFPHHDNELAQSEGHFGCTQWVNYFMHTGHLHIEGQKMSKSLKNFISIKEALEQSTAQQIRIMYLLHHWDSTLDWSAGSLSEARTIEVSINNFLALVKALAQEEKFKERVISETHNYGSAEKELMDVLFQKQEAIYAALADSFNTPLAMTELRQLISVSNQYYQTKNKVKATPNITILAKIGVYVTKLLRIFGVYPDINPEFGAPVTEGAQNSEEALMPYLRVLSSFRDAVRELAQAKADPVEFLKLSDRLRDMDLFELGVILDDKEDGKALVKIVDRKTLMSQRKAIQDKELERQRDKEERLKIQAQKKAERLEKGRMPPSQMFKTAEFSAWDEQGMPTLDKEGVEITKSRRKRLDKDYAIQTKLHAEFLAGADSEKA